MRRVSWPNRTARSIAPTAITARTAIPMVPAPAMTAGIVKTPVPTMLPTTSPVAEVSPSVWAFLVPRSDRTPGGVVGGCGGAEWFVVGSTVSVDMLTPFHLRCDRHAAPFGGWWGRLEHG